MAQQLVERLSPATLRAIAPPAKAAIIGPVGLALPRVLPRYDIVTPLRIAHFLAQAAHESDSFKTLKEHGGPAYFARYEGRKDLGNVKAGDGARYHGRGIFQLTGRANYREFGGLLSLDLEGDPERAADPEISLEIACLYWQRRKLNAPAEQDDAVRVTKLINGGRNGLAHRVQLLGVAKREIAALVAAGLTSDDPAHYPILRRGSDNDAAIEELQARLRKHGFPITIDGDFGPATELAVKTVQTRAGLVSDGVVGPLTWRALVPPDREA